ncbi:MULTISPECIES: EAL domain-containing protein [unclassified Pseudomonas]|uniref:bifunctional diguanylate cyclase/phosphodiesterase n=1 Tax=unclassified Pseudomonas TaxID=196821 RepID=UPI0021145EC2|nr:MULTISPECIES: EAL domain-containing protein [unclassified Pseudomonas]
MQVENEIGHNIINYAKWGEAYKHLHLAVDLFWANDERNVGDIPYELYGYNGVFVLDPQDRTVYAVIDGRPTQRAAAQWLEGDLAGLLAATRQRPGETESLVRVLSVGGVPALVAAATITPGASYSVAPGPGAPSVMLFVNVLDTDTLAHLSDTYGLPRLEASRAPLVDHETLRLLDSPLLLNWQPPQPGAQLLHRTLPVFLAGVLLLGLVLALLIRHALNSARQLDQQFDALVASQAELSRSEKRFRELAEAASDWLWESDAAGRITYLSERFARITGHAPGSWLGRPLAELFSSKTTRLAAWLQDNVHQRDERQVLRCHYRDRQGHARVCEITARPLPESAGFRGTASDITTAVNAQAEIEHLSQHDSLTGLANRLQLQHYLARKLTQARTPLTLLSLDLDRFKPVNDSLGHAAGDRVLQEIARRLQASLRPGGLVARLGGDEFIVVLLGHLDVATVDQICARLVNAIGRPILLEEQSVSVGTSIGIAQAPDQATQVEDLLRLADIALYQAKAAGRNGWCFHAPAMDAQLSQRRDLEQELRQALALGQLRSGYLPRRNAAAGRLSAIEVRLHWAHPRRGLLSPELFLPLAEETGLSVPLEFWLLDNACQAAATWPAPLRLVVGLSARPFADGEALVAAVARALQTSGLVAERLELQLPEALLQAGSAPMLMPLKALGVRLSLADFGRGSSALEALRHPVLDAISLDSRLVARLEDQQVDAAIAQALIGLGRTLGLRVTATGVETPGQLAWLQAQHCDEVQGPLFGPSLTDRELAALLATDLQAG